MYPDTPAIEALPKAEKKAIAKSVQKSKPVDVPSMSTFALAYAPRYVRSQWVLGALWSSVGVIVLQAAGLRHVLISFVGVVLRAVVLTAVPFYTPVRANRSIALNQALMT
jgi:sulfite exporter TauE/SafE